MTTEISRIEIFAKDENVGRIQRILAGIVISIKSVPVANARVDKAGNIVASSPGDLMSMFAGWLGEKKLSAVNAALARDFLASLGRSPTSYSNLLTRAQEAGLLRKNKGRNQANTTYTVVAATSRRKK